MMSMLKSVGQRSRKTTTARRSWPGGRHSQATAAPSMRQGLQEDTLGLCPVLATPSLPRLAPVPALALQLDTRLAPQP